MQTAPAALDQTSSLTMRHAVQDVDQAHEPELDVTAADKAEAVSNPIAIAEGPVLASGTINPRFEDMQYAVRGALVARAAKYEAALAAGGEEAEALPFDAVTW